MPSLRDRRRTDTRERILAAAIRLFATKGYSTTSIAEIEGAVGLRPGSGGLYRHFRSKEALFVAAVSDYAERVRQLRASLAGGLARPGPRSLASDLRHLVSALADFLSGEQPIVQATADAASLPPTVRAVIANAWDEGYGMATDVFDAQGVDPAEARVLGIAAIGSINHYLTHLSYWGREPGEVPLEDFVEGWIKVWSTVVPVSCAGFDGATAADQGHSW